MPHAARRQVLEELSSTERQMQSEIDGDVPAIPRT
jgi:hypothetical protein